MQLAMGAPGPLFAEQIAFVFRQLPIACAVNIINASLTAMVLLAATGEPLPAFWFASIAFATLARWILWRCYRRGPIRAEDIRWWSRLATGAAALTGLCWGGGGALLFSAVPVFAQIFLTIVIGGMCAGAVVMSAMHLPTLLASRVGELAHGDALSCPGHAG